MSKRAPNGAAAVNAKRTLVLNTLILKLLSQKPMSTVDLVAEGVDSRQNCTNRMTRLKRAGKIEAVVTLPNRGGGSTTYYRPSGALVHEEDLDYCGRHHTFQQWGSQREYAPRATSDAEASAALLEAEMKDEASAKSRKIVPFRCWLTTAFYGPYVKERS